MGITGGRALGRGLTGLAVAALVLMTAGCATGSGRHGAALQPTPVSVQPTVTEPPTTAPPAPQPVPPGEIADAAVPVVHLYDAPGASAPADTMANPTSMKVPLVFLVRQRLGTDWLQVQVPSRPNERVAWVEAAEVTTRDTTLHIQIQLGAHHLAAFDGDNPAPVFETTVAIGTADTPTPTGQFYIDARYKLANPNGPYGAWALSVAAFSNVLYSFSGGPGQIAIHGTNRPALIGTPASHGCVRMTNPDISRLVDLVPIGTPVDISA